MKTSRFLVLVAWVILYLLALSSCRSARWHMDKARKKDPSLFVNRVDTVEVMPGAFELNCDSLLALQKDNQEPLIFYVETPTKDPGGSIRKDSARVSIKRRDTYKPQSKEDSVKMATGTLTREDSLRIHQALLDFEIDCPDCKNEKEIIYIPPSFRELISWFWRQIPWWLYLLISVIFLSVIYKLIRWSRK